MVTSLTIVLHFILLWFGGQGTPQNRPAPPRINARSPHGPLAVPCENCHTLTSFKPIRAVPEFDHGQTRFSLRGMHQGVSCAQCHISMVFSNVGTTCSTCHADIHRGQFGGRCEQCHTVTGWASSIRTIQNHQNRFPLVGAHATADCESCHTGGATAQFSGLSTDCLSCHLRDFQAAKSPDHQALNYSTSCQSCHSMNGWAGTAFDHLRSTGFALTGAHASLDCASCHVGGRFRGTPANCVGCHTNDYHRASDPNHVQAGFSTDCQTCHTTATWSGARFDHNLTSFPLTGAHVNVACESCHTSGQYAGTSTDCFSCHVNNFNATTNPNHLQAGLPTSCQTCHTTSTWQGAAFDHSRTAFPLSGAHVNVACESCHTNSQYTGTSTDCFSCHVNDFNATTNPSHVQASFPTTCQSCHTVSAWSGAVFDHNALTNFPLVGAHVSVPCASCHINGRFAGTPANCFGCHLNDFNAATNPSHVQAGFPTDCTMCHSSANWSGARFDHNRTNFRLNGAHVSVGCTTCHVNGIFAGLGTACSTCHLTNFMNTTNPSHIQFGIPQDCAVCHNTSAWQPAKFDHKLTGFPLSGVHARVPCANCHLSGNYSGTPADCYSCHLTEYHGVTDPNHIAANFSTTCQSCHSTSKWTGATFNHHWFPVYSGAHKEKWNTCGECHTNSSNYVQFSCIICHQHNDAETTPKHKKVQGYVYNATSCFSCHPQGKH